MGNELTKVLLEILLAVAIPALIAVARQYILRIRYAWLRELVDDIVNAVEKQFGERSGAEKKGRAEMALAARRIKLTDQVDTLIEASVNKLPTRGDGNNVT